MPIGWERRYDSRCFLWAPGAYFWKFRLSVVLVYLTDSGPKKSQPDHVCNASTPLCLISLSLQNLCSYVNWRQYQKLCQDRKAPHRAVPYQTSFQTMTFQAMLALKSKAVALLQQLYLLMLDWLSKALSQRIQDNLYMAFIINIIGQSNALCKKRKFKFSTWKSLIYLILVLPVQIIVIIR